MSGRREEPGVPSSRGIRRTARAPSEIAAAWRRGALLLAAVALLGGCEPSSPTVESSLSREAFIAVYLDLRRAALMAPEAQIPEGRKAEILQAHGVSEDELLAFADAHGRDTEFMASVWAEIERLLAAERARADSAR